MLDGTDPKSKATINYETENVTARLRVPYSLVKAAYRASNLNENDEQWEKSIARMNESAGILIERTMSKTQPLSG